MKPPPAAPAYTAFHGNYTAAVCSLLGRPTSNIQHPINMHQPTGGHSRKVEGNSPKTPYRPREAVPPSCPVARASCPVDHPCR
eukprot:1169125-Prorocentrum_minimum.AAC.1